MFIIHFEVLVDGRTFGKFATKENADLCHFAMGQCGFTLAQLEVKRVKTPLFGEVA